MQGILPGTEAVVEDVTVEATLPWCPENIKYQNSSTETTTSHIQVISISPPERQGCCDETETDEADFQGTRVVPPQPPEGGTSTGKRPTTADSTQSYEGLEPIVQFSASIYYCSEEETFMRLDVLRIGSLSERSEIFFRTVDGTAKSGDVYDHIEGRLIFEPGENTQEVQVPLRSNGKWNPTLEFTVKLEEEDKVNATLGRYLWQARVKVIDVDAFPTNRYKEDLVKHDLAKIPKFSLLVEYFKMNLDDPIVKRGTIFAMLVDQLHNLYFIQKLFVTVYLVDYVLNLESSDDRLFILKDRRASLLVIMFSLVVPYGLLHLLEYSQLSNGVDSTTRAMLQINLLRKFLNYDERARAEIKAEDLTMAMTRDSVDLAHKGFMNVLSLAQAFGKLLTILIFQFSSSAVFGMPLRGMTFLPMFLFPIILGLFLIARRARTTKYLDQQHRRLDQMVGHVNETVTNYRLIADYNRRPVFVDKYGDTIGAYNDAFTEAEQVVFNNAHVAPWLTLLFVAIYTLVGGMQVINAPDVSLGLFLTDLSVFEQIGSAYGKIYETFMQMQMAFPALLRITMFMNMPIDVPARMRLNRHRRAVTAHLRQELRKKSHVGIPLDRLPIKVDNLNFSHNAPTLMRSGSVESTEELSQRPVSPRSPASPRAIWLMTSDTKKLAKKMKNVINQSEFRNSLTVSEKMPSKRPTNQINYSGKMEINQSQLVFIIGPRGEGKSTLLKIIGAVIPPEVKGDEVVFIPSHLRVLHIWAEAMFFRGTLLENLIFGVSPGDTDARLQRVIAICRQLSLPQDVLDLIESDKVLDWGHVLSQTQRCLLSLARALIANPEVLCVHKPTLPFDEHTSMRVVKLLKSFVMQKGLEQDPNTHILRRPRTCIVSSSKLVGVEEADLVFHVCSMHGIRQVEKHLLHEVTID